MDTAQTFTEAVLTGREIEFTCGANHYFESRNTDTDWYIYCEETRAAQHFSSGRALLAQAVLQGENISQMWGRITIDCIL